MIYWQELDKYAVISTIKHSERQSKATFTWEVLSRKWQISEETAVNSLVISSDVNLIGSTWNHKSRINAPVNQSVLHAVPLQCFEITWEKLKICDSEILLTRCLWQSIRQSGVMLPHLGRVLIIIVMISYVLDYHKTFSPASKLNLS